MLKMIDEETIECRLVRSHCIQMKICRGGERREFSRACVERRNLHRQTVLRPRTPSLAALSIQALQKAFDFLCRSSFERPRRSTNIQLLLHQTRRKIPLRLKRPLPSPTMPRHRILRTAQTRQHISTTTTILILDFWCSRVPGHTR